jgi:hypothetical protein
MMWKNKNLFSKISSLSVLAFTAKILGGFLIGCVIAFYSIAPSRQGPAGSVTGEEVQDKKLSILPMMLVGGIHVFRKGMEKK